MKGIENYTIKTKFIYKDIMRFKVKGQIAQNGVYICHIQV